MSELRVSLVQTSLIWENIPQNLERFDDKLSNLKGNTDLIILPEMFTTGFSMNVKDISETMDGSAMNWMRGKAKELNAIITGSLIIEEEGKYYNRLIWMKANGTHSQYDKRHLFTLAKEHHTFTAGRKKLIVEWNDWKICPLVCYDLRFPVWSRNVENYDVLVYMANFPAKRRYAWRHLLRARAIENQCYVLGVNIVGEDGNGFAYSGDTSVIDPMGHLIKEFTEQEGIINYTISKSEIDNIRKTLPFLDDRDKFIIQ